MKAFLLHKDRDFDAKRAPPWNAAALTQDLGLDALFDAMAAGDEFFRETARSALLAGLDNDAGTILYRQKILIDCLNRRDVVKEVYDAAVDAIEGERAGIWFFGRTPSSVLSRAIEDMRVFAAALRRLRRVADAHSAQFESEGFGRFFAMIRTELDDGYLAGIDEHLARLKFPDGVMLSAALGKGNRGAGYVLHKIAPGPQGWLARLFPPKPPGYSFELDPRDESGARALGELTDRGVNLVADALAQSADHILAFFKTLRCELSFYLGCANLHERLSRKGEPVCFPIPTAPGRRKFSCRGLYDPGLSLGMEGRVTGSDANADERDLVVITGANQGGKSTFLRGVGLAQLMMQAGMFAAAEAFSAELCDGLFTHYRREEDAGMASGKLDEELVRMSAIVDRLTPRPLLLFNESFAATNEREGSEIARQIVGALLERRVRLFFVTHLHEFALGFYNGERGRVRFLRAVRRDDGERTFKLVEGEPLRTSYGEDLYGGVFDR